MKNTYKLPVTLTRFTNFDIDFDKLIDSINKYNHDSKPDLVKTEVTYEILSNYFSDYQWGSDTYEVLGGGEFDDFETNNDDSYFTLANEIFSNGQDWLMDCYEEATTEEVS